MRAIAGRLGWPQKNRHHGFFMMARWPENSNEENKMNKFDQLIIKSRLFNLEQQEWYLRNFRIGTETRSYIFECFEFSMIKIFGDDEMARDIIEELR